MASDLSKAQFRGLLIPDPRLGAIWTAESSFNQADPQPGIPAAQGSYDLSLTASGDQAAAGQMRIRTQKPGHPSKSGPGAFVWRNSGDTYWRGWDVPNAITNFQSVIWTDGTGVTISAKTPSVVTMDDGTVVTAYYRLSGLNHQIRTRVMSSSADTFSAGVTVYSQTSAPSAKLNDGFYPCLLKLPGDRLLLYFLTEVENLGNVRAYQSTDKGASWELAASSVLAEPVSLGTATGTPNTTFTMSHIRAAYGGGQVLMIITTPSNDTAYTNRATIYKQYASDSAGLVFAKIEDGPTSTGSLSTLSAAEDLRRPSVAYQASAFVVGRVNSSALGGIVSLVRIGSAYQKISAGTVANSPSSSLVMSFSVSNTITVSDDGSIYIYTDGKHVTTNDRYGVCYASFDDGATVVDLGKADIIPDNGADVGPGGVWWNFDNSTVGPDNCAATFARGRVLMMCNHFASPGNEDNSLHLLTLGGSSTVTMPSLSGYMAETRRSSWTETWLPFDLPGDTGTWTATVTGTQTLDNGQVELSTGAGQDAYFAASLTSAVYTAGLLVRFSLICTSGSVSNDACSVRLRIADGADDYDISIRFSPAAFRLYDNNAGAAVGADVALDMTTRREFLVSFIGGSTGNNDGAVQIWYRTKSSSNDRVWTKSASSATLTDDTVSPAAISYVQWGHDNQLAVSKWDEFHVCRGTPAGQNIVSQVNPDDLWAKPYASSGYRSYVDSGLFVTAHDGPARLADEYNIDTRYGFAIDRIFFSESQTPRVKWRSTDETEQTIALALDQTLLGTDDSQPGNDVIGLALMGINWKTGELQGYDSGTSTWATISTIDAAAGLSSLDWIRDGNSIRPSAGSAGSQYLQQHEFAGGHFGLADALAIGIPLRKIQTNTAGKWSGSTVQKLPTILLEDVEAADRASGSLGYICPPNICIISKLNGSKYAGYRLKIDAQDTVEGYFTVGSMVLGWVSAFGRSYSRGRILETTANTSVIDRTDGTTTSKNYGPAARTAQISWTDGVDVSAVHGSSPDPDYIKGSEGGSAQAVASVADVPYQIEGIVRMLDGPDRPVVYLPSIDKAGVTIVLNRRQQFIAGRLTQPARLESVLGDELQDPGEVFRVATVNIREIV